MAAEREPDTGAGDLDDRDNDGTGQTVDEGPHSEEDERRAAEETEPPAAEEMSGPS